VERLDRRLVPETDSPRWLADDADARATVRLLEGVRSIVDVTIWVWQPETERWRMLSLEEARALWEYRGRLADA